MSNQRRMKSEKEVNALALNQKEDRLLARTFRTLELENGYSTNLLTLNYRTVKGNYKHLKERVSKIKSNLAPEEILELRQLETAGKLKPMITTFNLNAAMKIAAAARRLKLYPEAPKRSRSAHTRRSQRTESTKLLTNRPTTSNQISHERSNSVTGVFTDAPPPDLTKRRNSLEGVVTTIRPLSASNPSNLPEEEKNREKSRPSTTSGLDREKTSLSKVSFKNAMNGYSSHTFAEKDPAMLNISRTPRESKPSFLTDDLVEPNLGSDIYEERRHELLNEEHLLAAHLESRKNAFLGKVDDYLKENPPVKFQVGHMLKTPVDIATSESEDDNESDISKSHSRRRRFRRNFDFSRTFTSEEAYRQRGNDIWKDMNKTRYLRLPDDKLDLSGVVTLAKDQMKLFQLLRSSEPAHLIQ